MTGQAISAYLFLFVHRVVKSVVCAAFPYQHSVGCRLPAGHHQFPIQCNVSCYSRLLTGTMPTPSEQALQTVAAC